MTARTLFFASLGAAALLASCSTMSDRTQDLTLGMFKEQAVKVLGKDFQTVGARDSSVHGKVEVIRYKNDDGGDLLLYFRDGRLIQWGDTDELSNIPE